MNIGQLCDELEKYPEHWEVLLASTSIDSVGRAPGRSDAIVLRVARSADDD